MDRSIQECDKNAKENLYIVATYINDITSTYYNDITSTYYK